MTSYNSRLCTSLVLVIILTSCNTSFTPTKKRIYVVQEVKFNDDKSFFWFRDQQQITHEGLSYFQVSEDKCKLSVEAANAYCQMPEQVLDYKNDTVFILTRSDIVFIKPTDSCIIKAVDYENGLYDIGKRPKEERMYFLDTECPQ